MMSNSNPNEDKETGEFQWNGSPLTPQEVRQLQGENIKDKLHIESLRTIIHHTYSAVGGDFFEFLVEELARFLGAKYAFIARRIDESASCRLMAWYGPDGSHRPSPSIEVTFPPENIRGKHLAFYPRDLRDQFPNTELFQTLEVNSYLALTILHPQLGGVIGHLGVMNHKPFRDNLPDVAILRALAGRAGTEIIRKEVEEKLRESEERYRLLVEKAPDAIFIEIDEKVAFANHAALSLLGFQEQWQVKGLHLSVFMDEGTREDLREYLRKNLFHQGKPWAGTIRDRRGHQIQVELTALETTYRGREALQFMVRDVTEMERLRLKTQEMQYLAKLGEFSSIISHEIRNPLGSIQLNLQNLAEDNLTESQEKLCNNLHQGIRRIQRVVQDILSYSRTSPLNLERVDFNQVVQSCLHTAHEKIASERVEVTTKLSAEPVYVTADVYQILQILENLVHNAVQALRDERRVEVTVGTTGERGWVEVRDWGVGIPRDNLDQVFEPFFTTRSAGTGLGLAVSRRIAEMHRGTLLVDSEAGRGSVFKLILPLAHRPDEKE